jgi:hypothetical protein
VRLKAIQIQCPKHKLQATSDAGIGETVSPVITGFNRSLRVESRTDRLTGDPEAVLLREVLERGGIVSWMTARLNDPRSKVDVTHDLASLIRTSVLLAAQGWRDHGDADALRHDPAFRIAASSAAGRTPLEGPGLASQLTLSRFTAILAEPANIRVLRGSVDFQPEVPLVGAQFSLRNDACDTFSMAAGSRGFGSDRHGIFEHYSALGIARASVHTGDRATDEVVGQYNQEVFAVRCC